MVNTPALYIPVTPVGNVPAVIDAPVPPPPIAYVMLVNGEFTQISWASVPAADVRLMVALGLTVMVPVAVMFPHPPISVTV
ncbi:hypothetical protein SDC9_28973 [bioreactor metagenome]|uniref:Uncharacterized protein n=1 Tax=bioreactor metagenome TaxID=1076179 RepID=A0A644UWI2_9ZZZZ